jgi:hypothetical protein
MKTLISTPIELESAVLAVTALFSSAAEGPQFTPNSLSHEQTQSMDNGR